MILSFLDISASNCSSISSSESDSWNSVAPSYPLVLTWNVSIKDLRKKIAGCTDEEMVKFTLKDGSCTMTVTGKRCTPKDVEPQQVCKRRIVQRSPVRHVTSTAGEDNGHAAMAMPLAQVHPEVEKSPRAQRPHMNKRKSKKKQTYLNCPICPPNTVRRNSMRRHAVEFHLPWFVVPDLTCWTCREAFRAKEKLNAHVEASCANGGFDEHHVATWCHLMNSLISRLRFDLDCGDNNELMMIAKRIAEAKSTNVTFMQQEELSLMICHAEYQGNVTVEKSALSLDTMAHDSCLVDWRVIFWLMAEAGHDDGKKLTLDCTTARVGAVDDSHCHLREWAERHGMREHMVATRGGEDKPNLGRVITNWCWPNRWLEIPRDIVHTSSTEILHTVGVHPSVINRHGCISNDEWARLEDLLDHKEVVGLGEVGLDYKETTGLQGQLDQRKFLRQAADLAHRRKLPMVLNLCGRCSDEKQEIHLECIDILRERLSSDAKLHIHCFLGPKQAAESWLSYFPNTMFGCGPVIMGSNVSSDVRETFTYLPSTAILLETDTPYYRCKEIQHPWQVSHILNRLASLRHEEVDILGQQIYKNCTKMYKS